MLKRFLAFFDNRQSMADDFEIWPGLTMLDLNLKLKPTNKGIEAVRVYLNDPSKPMRGPEQAVDAPLQRLWSNRLSRHIKKLTNNQKMLDQASMNNPEMEIKGSINQFKHAVSNTMGTAKRNIAEAARSYRELEELRAGFMAKTGVGRPPKPYRWWLTGSLLVILLIVESILNGNFLAAGHERGLIGGFLTAVGISVFNIGLAFIAGFFFIKRLLHSKQLLKVTALAITILCIAILAYFNLSVAHLRDALSKDIADAASYALAAAWNLQAPRNFESLLLTYLGLGFSGVSGIKGFFTGDPFPGYTALGQKCAQASEDLHHAHQTALDMIKIEKSNHDGQIDATAEKYIDSKRQLAELTYTGREIIDTAQREAEALNKAANELRQKYIDGAVSFVNNLKRSATINWPEIQNEILLTDPLANFSDIMNGSENSGTTLEAMESVLEGLRGTVAISHKDIAEAAMTFDGEINDFVEKSADHGLPINLSNGDSDTGGEETETSSGNAGTETNE